MIDSKRITVAQVRKLVRALATHGRSEEDAEDIVQEAFLCVQSYSNEIHDLDAVVYVTARRIAITKWRRSRRLKYEELPADLLDPTPTPERQLTAKDSLRDIQERLDAVSIKTRQIFFAHRAGYAYEEIAQHLGISFRTIEKHICRAARITQRLIHE